MSNARDSDYYLTAELPVEDEDDEYEYHVNPLAFRTRDISRIHIFLRWMRNGFMVSCLVMIYIRLTCYLLTPQTLPSLIWICLGYLFVVYLTIECYFLVRYGVLLSQFLVETAHERRLKGE